MRSWGVQQGSLGSYGDPCVIQAKRHNTQFSMTSPRAKDTNRWKGRAGFTNELQKKGVGCGKKENKSEAKF